MRCTATDPTAELDAQQCEHAAVAIVGLADSRVRLTGAVCARHVDTAVAWLHELSGGTVAIAYL